MARVSVVMGVCNGGALLEPAVRSILAQTGVDLRFLIMDDGSRDGSADDLRRIAGEDPRIVLRLQENEGLHVALNRLIAEDQTPYVARMDADDLSLPWRLQAQVEYMDAHPQVGAAGMWSILKAPGEDECSCLCYPDDHDWLLAQMERGWNTFVHSSVIMRRSVLARLPGPYRFRFLQDFDLWLRIAGLARLGMVERVGHVSHCHPGRVSGRDLQLRQRLHGAILRLHRERRRLGREASDAADLEAGLLAAGPGHEHPPLSAAWYRGMSAVQRGDLDLARRVFRERVLKGDHDRLHALKWLLAVSLPPWLGVLPRFVPPLAHGRSLAEAVTPEELTRIRAFLRESGGLDAAAEPTSQGVGP